MCIPYKVAIIILFCDNWIFHIGVLSSATNVNKWFFFLTTFCELFAKPNIDNASSYIECFSNFIG